MRNLAKGDDLIAEAGDVDIEVRHLDVCDPDSASEALANSASIDVLVNSAGFELQEAIELIDDDLMHRQLDTNVVGPLRTIRAVMPTWRKRGHGANVNVNRVVGPKPRRCLVAPTPHRRTPVRECRRRCAGKQHLQESVFT
jgi:NAD(P)-dependent dehydrogenase (short-subunit alcohol dehydrogenase family)